MPSATSPYVTDPQNEYVQDATSDAIGSVNMVLCIMSAMNVSGSGMLNVGPYIALIDMNKCQSHGSSGSSAGGASGASAAANYMTAVVDATRASNTDPMVAKIWMSMTENGTAKDIYREGDRNPVANGCASLWRVPHGLHRQESGGGAMQFNGYINSAAGALQF